MPTAVRLRDDFSAEALRALARRSKDVNQSRRILTLEADPSRQGDSAPCPVPKTEWARIAVQTAKRHSKILERCPQ